MMKIVRLRWLQSFNINSDIATIQDQETDI